LKPETANLTDEKGGSLTLTAGWKVLSKESVEVETSQGTVKGEKGGWKIMTPKNVTVKDDKGMFTLPSGWSVLSKGGTTNTPSTDNKKETTTGSMIKNDYRSSSQKTSVNPNNNNNNNNKLEKEGHTRSASNLSLFSRLRSKSKSHK